MRIQILALALLIKFILLTCNVHAQSVGINSTGLAPDNSALLDLNSTDKGFLITRVDTANILSPAFGLMTLAPTDSCLYLYNGIGWVSMGGGGSNCICDFSNSACPIPTAVTASVSPNPICVGNNLILTGGATGATSWLWTGPNAFTSTIQNPTITNVTSAEAGIYSLTASNSCGVATTVNTAFATVNTAIATPGPIAGLATPPCAALGVTYSIAAVNGASSYNWTVPAGATIITGQGTPSITVDVGTITNGNICVTVTNACGTSAPSCFSITVGGCSGPPAQPALITSFFGCGTAASPGVDCPKYYKVTDDCNNTYLWTFPTGWTILSGQGTNQVQVQPSITSGVISVTPSNACGTGQTQTLAVTPTGTSYIFPPNNSSGNLFIFSNYNGGALTIDIDVDIPNIKIGIVSYEIMTVNIIGAYAGNVTSVAWAGFTPGTTITGAPGSIAVTPPVTLANSCGNTSIICSYTCLESGCGGCNTPDQIVHYFNNSVFSGNTFNFHRTQYGVWGSTQFLSTGADCSY
jgi:hypothetical protein